MPRISQKASVILSIIMASAFIAAVAVFAVAMPFAFSNGPTRDFINTIAAEKLGEEGAFAAFLVWGYCILAVVLACCIAVLLLLFRVRGGLVFTEKSVSYIRFISWGCLVLAAVILAAWIVYPAALVFALAAAFLGICLRVVKNVVEAATAIKNENDLTV